MLNDDEIVTSVQAESDPVDDETDEDEDNNNESSKGTSNAGTFSTLETAMECVRFHILHGSHSKFGYPNNRVSERYPVPIDSDKRRSTVLAILVYSFTFATLFPIFSSSPCATQDQLC
ncbi:hypothetical protein TNCV_3412751 [Trichonephila clavipes]|uniref:Uncharacterized protein n=1 Tax=Trichonephila clavipes TaxID=2585209 RepID=A0A8X6RRM3_TRICX|nr:hypothetical protein TNCV_3412751 [Trichonephila clavipes]